MKVWVSLIKFETDLTLLVSTHVSRAVLSEIDCNGPSRNAPQR
jgi:hypothetical protein